MKTVHFVYSHGPEIRCPNALGRNVGALLQRHYDVVYHEWDSHERIQAEPDAVLLGHPHPHPQTTFRRSMLQSDWGRVVAMFPFSHGNSYQVAFADAAVRRCDAYLAVTGNHWFNTIDESLFSHWKPKMVHLDLAIDRKDFPVLKRAFNPPGKRRFLYIGHTAWCKNPTFLSRIARSMPNSDFGWIGKGRRRLAGIHGYGWLDFAAPANQAIVAEHDFMITVGSSDANPVTILEAMAWGLVPVCTPQSGYEGYRSIINVPLNDVDRAVSVLRELQAMPTEQLEERQSENWQLLDKHFTWKRFAAQVEDAIEAPPRDPVRDPSPWTAMKIRGAAFASPYSPMRPRNVCRELRRRIRKSMGKHAPTI